MMGDLIQCIPKTWLFGEEAQGSLQPALLQLLREQAPASSECSTMKTKSEISYSEMERKKIVVQHMITYTSIIDIQVKKIKASALPLATTKQLNILNDSTLKKIFRPNI